jgi:DNA-binding transcriptional regulator YiaG
MQTRWNGEGIKALRGRTGLTQEDLAHEVGVSTSTVNRWENGHSQPSRLACHALQRISNTAEDSAEETGRGVA